MQYIETENCHLTLVIWILKILKLYVAYLLIKKVNKNMCDQTKTQTYKT